MLVLTIREERGVKFFVPPSDTGFEIDLERIAESKFGITADRRIAIIRDNAKRKSLEMTNDSSDRTH